MESFSIWVRPQEQQWFKTGVLSTGYYVFSVMLVLRYRSNRRNRVAQNNSDIADVESTPGQINYDSLWWTAAALTY